MMFRGVFVAVVTPFDSSGGVDLESYQRHLAYLIENGVDGLVPCGTTGEGTALDPFERTLLLREALSIVRKKNVQVIAGCSGNRTDKVCKLVNEAEKLGCDGALVATPYYNKPSPEGLFRHYEVIAQSTHLPILLYNVPSRTGVSLPIEITKRLFEIPNVVGIKEASGEYQQWLHLATSIDTSKKSLLAGDDNAFAVIQALGGTGIISACANLAPKQFSTLYEFMKSRNWDDAFQLQKRLASLIAALFSETSPAPVKFALSALGRMEPHLRLPLVPVRPGTEQLLLGELRRLELLK